MIRLGTKLTIALSLIIIVVLSGYGYLSILTRRESLVRKMQLEAKSIGRTLGVALGKSTAIEIPFTQNLMDAIEEYERTLGVIVYYLDPPLILCSRSLSETSHPDLSRIKESLRDNRVHEGFGTYQGIPVYLYSFPIHNEQGKSIGRAMVLQNATFVEKDIRQAEWSVIFTTLLLIAVTVVLVLFTTNRWVTKPLALLAEGIERIAKGHFSARIDIGKGNEEISKVASAFNQMAMDLEKARNQILEEAEAKVTLERSLRQSEKLALVGKLASELAHEIRTPLTSIKIFIQSLEQEMGSDDHRNQDFRIVKKEIDRINENITRLLNFAKPEDPQFESVQMETILKETLNLLMSKIKLQDIQLEIALPDPPTPIKGDPKQLRQILLNLLLNAIEAMPHGGRLTIRGEVKGDGDGQPTLFQLTIRDTGQGILQDHLPYIFDPFFTTKEGGTGLGLSIVSSLVQKHEGEIEVESDPGRGTTFTLLLPLRKER